MASGFKQKFYRVLRMKDADVRRLAMQKTELSSAARLALMMYPRYNRRAVRDDDKWVTINGTHVMVGEGGNVKAGPSRLKRESNNSTGGKQKADGSSFEHKKRVAKPVEHSAVPSQKFVPALDTAKATCRPEAAWRVDSTRKAEDFDNEKIETHVTKGGSTFALKSDGDIISVCKNCNSDERGSEILAAAVKAGGTHLDSFDGNYEFYTKCGFEVVSRCKFDEQYAPDGWVKGRDEPEDVVFMKYVGPGKTQDSDKDAMRKRVPYSKDYGEAEAVLKRQVKRGNKT